MKKLLLLLYVLPFFSYAQSTCREVVGYYAGWQWYDRNRLMNPQSVPYQKYSILTYSFMQPQSNGTIAISDPWGDKNQLLGPINWAVAPAGYDTQFDFGNAAYHLSNQKLSDYAHAANCKLLVSVGGWTYSANFPGIAADPAIRAAFAHDCNTMVQLYGLDGIDIDWEYPSTVSEKQNYTLLLQQVRDSLDAIESVVGRPLLLSIAAGASSSHMQYVDWTNALPLLDMINLMSYDFYGTWSPTTNHNAPLYPVSSGAQSGFSCSEAVTNLMSYGVPPDRINMGVAWYGRSHLTNGAPGLHVSGTGQSDMIHFSMDDGTPLYYNVLNALNQFDYHWDSVAQVPYLTGITTNSFVSFDNEISIELKAQYINAQQLRGAIIWEISGDYVESTTNPGTIAATPLIDQLNTTFCNGSTGLNHPKEISVHVSPQPAQDFVTIMLDQHDGNALRLVIMDLLGNEMMAQHVDGRQSVRLDCSSWPAGIYFLQVISANWQRVMRILKT